MAKYLLDTNICIFILQQKFFVREKVISVGIINCFVSAITIAELTFGAYQSNDYESHKNDAQRIMSLATVLPILDSLNTYGKEKARFRKDGNLIPEFDLLIATTALHHGMTLVSNNTKHMSRIEGLMLENWTKAEDNEFT
ncbi:type II toxin-antitoxin system VapC family toxin [Neolewinella agarilytica]|uniref:tRNA(fMet)-specific endonuclease VapC n=1 Tax=Neolewinella agarilytica TaxID=478744 RepID=A0A1H9AMN2_9BACT|nr:type II toxin-antitoxin system VapC family toxin [Neolewinella agarilytica]SEP77980.1 tRNA(fMet)-specific endonuclease VapC [Neolewinella agarilytica]